MPTPSTDYLTMLSTKSNKRFCSGIPMHHNTTRNIHIFHCSTMGQLHPMQRRLKCQHPQLTTSLCSLRKATRDSVQESPCTTTQPETFTFFTAQQWANSTPCNAD